MKPELSRRTVRLVLAASLALLAALVLTATPVSASTSNTVSFSTSAAAAQFVSFKDVFGKTYANPVEEKMRFQFFLANVQRMATAQAANPHAAFGINRFFDLSQEEFRQRYASGEAYFRHALATNAATPREGKHLNVTDAPEKIDWREKKVVTPVKDQESCGSCWAFSTIGNIEAMWALAGNDLIRLSEEQLVSCDDNDGGCNGGLMDRAYDWLLANTQGQVFTEKSYPYASGTGSTPDCDMADRVVGAVITGYSMVDSNEDVIAAYLATNGPLAIAVDASAFLSYTGGILTDCMGSHLNHGVLLVGYDDTGDVPYWIIKNSWGESWGEEGYIRVSKGTNECLMSEYVITARVSTEPITTEEPTPKPTIQPGTMMAVRGVCSSYSCTDCKETVVPVGTCLPVHGGGSELVQCGLDQMIERAYTSKDCSGAPSYYVSTLDKCMISMRKSSINSCRIAE